MGRRSRNKRPQKSNTFQNFLFYFFFVFCIVILPLIIRRQALDISLMPRMLALFVFLLAFLLLLSREKTFRELDLSVLKKVIFPVFLTYLLLSIFSLLFATNYTAGLFDILKTFATISVMAFACLIILQHKNWSVELPKFFIITSIILLCIGFFEMISELGFGFHPRHQISRVQALMSNVNLYASFLMLLVPWTILGLFIYKRVWKAISAVSLVLLLLMILLLQTRAAYIGIIAGLMATSAMVFYHHQAFSLRRSLRNKLVIGAIAILGGVILLVSIAGEDNIYASRLQSSFSLSENEPRMIIWDMTARMITDYPITGVGAGNFTIRVPEYFGYHDLTGRPTNLLRPHNDPMWVLAEKGVFGLILFLAIFAVAVFYTWKVVAGNTDKEKKMLALTVFFALTGYFMNSLFDFPLERITHQVVLGIMLAVITTLYHLQVNEKGGMPVTGIRKIALIPIALILLVGVRYSQQALKQEKYLVLARAADIGQDNRAFLAYAKEASTPWRTIDRQGIPVAYTEGVAHSKLGDQEATLKKYEEARRHHPNRHMILINLGIIYIDIQEYDKAVECFTRVLSIFPLSMEALNNLAVCHIYLEDYDAALETLERIPENLRTDDVRFNISYARQQLQIMEMLGTDRRPGD